MSQSRVFVSHSHQDDGITSRIVADLKQAGTIVWVDVADVGAGDFQQRINDALVSCEYVVLVLTKDALASPWVQQEINAAIRLKHQGHIHDILPVQAGPVSQHDIPPLWGVFNIFDATRDYAGAIEAVVGVLSGAPPKPRGAPPQPAPVPRWKTETNPNGLFAMAHNAQEANNHAESVAILERAVQLSPSSVKAWEEAGAGYEKAGRYANALDAWGRVLALKSTKDTRDSDFQNLPELEHIAANLKRLGREREARDAYQRLLTAAERGIRIGRDWAFRWDYKSLALRALGREREAEKAAREAEKIRAGG